MDTKLGGYQTSTSRSISLPLAVCLSLCAIPSLFAQKPKLVVQTGHAAPVPAAAFSPDGKILATASHDKTIKLWEVACGKEIGTLTGHADWVLSVAFSPDGKILAGGCNDRTIKLWEVSTGMEIRTFKDSTSLGILFVTFSRDDKTLASVSREGRITLWQIATGKKISVLSQEAFEAHLVVFSPDGKTLASGGRSGRITLWEVTTGNRLRTLSGHSESVVAISFSPDGKQLMSASKDDTIKLWEIGTGKEILTLAHSGSVVSAAFSANGKVSAIGSGSEEGTITLWEIGTNRKIRSIAGISSAIHFVSFSPDGNVLASGTGDETVTLWEVGTGKKLHTLKGQAGLINHIAFSPDGKTLACANTDTTIRLWDIDTGRGFRTLMENDSEVNTVAFSPAGKVLASGSTDGTITLWDTDKSEKLRTLNMPIDDYAKYSTYNYSAIAFSPDGKTLARASYNDDAIILWEVDTGEELDAFTDSLIVYSLAFSPDGKILAAGVGYEIKLWRLRSGREFRSHVAGGLPVRTVAFSPDGKILASGNGDGDVTFWEMDALRGIGTIAGHSDAVNSITFSPDGKILASGSDDHTVKLWEVDTGNELHVFTGHFNEVTTVAFAPDGKIIASGSRDAKIKLWDSASGKEIASLIGLDEKDWVVVTPDDRFDGSPEGLRKIHYVRNNQLIPIDAFFEKLYAPRLLARVLSDEAEPLIPPAIDLSKGIKLPPLVKITSPQAGEAFTTDAIHLVIEVVDQGGGIDEIRLYQNGKLVADEQRNIKPITQQITKTFFVTLLAGMNEFKAVAFNNDRTESQPDFIRIELKAMMPESRLNILAIGINAYQNASYNLNYGKPDAQAFLRSVEKYGQGIFEQILKQELYDEQATKPGIESALNAISNMAKPQDVFVLFYAGHGVMSEGDAKTAPEFYLVPHDVTNLYRDDSLLVRKGLSAKQLKEFCVKIKAQKQLVVLDACQAGGAVETFAVRGMAEEKAIAQLARSTGAVVLAASGTEQSATEFGQLGHGVFTYALLQGLDGEADGGTVPDGKITVKELEAYLNDKVPELTKKYRGLTQYPNSYARGQDFPLGVLRSETSGK